MTATLVPTSTSTSISRLSEVQRVLSEVTRYPLDILEPNADFEEDLGIDSVKLGEVFSVLRERYNLPPMNEMDIPPERLRSVADLAQVIDEFSEPSISTSRNDATVTSKSSSVSGNNVFSSTEPTLTLTSSNGDVSILSINGSIAEVQRVLSEVTRYPLDILEPNADFEEDLGIDSVKLGEVFSVLRERYNLPPMNEMDIPPERLRSVADLAQLIDEFIASSISNFSEDSTASSKSNAVFNSKAINNLELPDSRDKNGCTSSNDHISKNHSSGNGHSNSSTPIAKENEFLDTVTLAKSSQTVTSAKYNQVDTQPLDGKVALVTGSGRGLGKVIAMHLAQLGATVVVNSFHSKDLGEATAAEIKEVGGKALHIWGSVANEVHLHSLFDQIESEFDHLDFFISNSSNGLLAPLKDIKIEHFEKAFQTNVIGLHQGAMRASKLMQKQGGGKIITLSTNAAHRYIPYFGCMATVKAAIEALTRYLAIELAPHNIQVNCITSGPVYGELVNKWPDSEELIPYWESISLGNKLCYPQDIADFVSYLLREEVKRINGSILLIDAGQAIHL